MFAQSNKESLACYKYNTEIRLNERLFSEWDEYPETDTTMIPMNLNRENWDGVANKIIYCNRIKICPKCFRTIGAEESNGLDSINLETFKNTSPFVLSKDPCGWKKCKDILEPDDSLRWYRAITEAETIQTETIQPPTILSKDAGIYCLSTQGYIKIGMSRKNAINRAKSQLVPNVALEWTLLCENPYEIEKMSRELLLKHGACFFNGTEWCNTSLSPNNLKDQMLELIQTKNPA